MSNDKVLVMEFNVDDEDMLEKLIKMQEEKDPDFIDTVIFDVLHEPFMRTINRARMQNREDWDNE